MIQPRDTPPRRPGPARPFDVYVRVTLRAVVLCVALAIVAVAVAWSKGGTDAENGRAWLTVAGTLALLAAAGLVSIGRTAWRGRR